MLLIKVLLSLVNLHGFLKNEITTKTTNKLETSEEIYITEDVRTDGGERTKK